MSAYSDYQASQGQGQGQAGEASAAARAVAKPSRGKGKPKAHRPKAHKPRSHRSKPLNRLDDPSQVTGPQTLRQIYQSADAATGLRYGAQERQLGLQTQQVPAWFAAYRAQVAGINQGIQTGYQKAITDVNSRAQQAQTTENAGRAQLQQADKKDAAAFGGQIDPSLYQNDASAGAVRRENQSAFANLLASQGQAQNSYFGGLQAAGSAAELAQNQRVAADKTALAGDKGLFRQGYVSDAQQQAHKNRLEDAAFSTPSANTVLSTRTSAANSRRSSRNQAKTRKAAAHEKATTPYSSGAFAGKSPAWVRKHPDQAQALTNSYNKLTHPGKAKKGATDTKDKANTHGRLKDINSRIDNYKTLPFTPKQFDKATQKWVPGKTRNPTRAEIVQRLLKEGSGKGGKFTMVEINKVLARRDRAMKRAAHRKASKPSHTPDNAHGY